MSAEAPTFVMYSPATAGLPLVGVSVFSGRRDPEWNLTAAEAVELAGLLDRLGPPARTLEGAPEGRLGFRWFYLRHIAHHLDLPPSQHPVELQVTRSSVTAIVSPEDQHQRQVVFDDMKSTVFSWILAKLPAHTDPSIYNLVVGDAPSP